MSAPGWKDEIRELEERSRVAFLAADLQTLDALWADGLRVNSPLERVNDKKEVLALLQSGRIRHRSYEIEIESLTRYGDVAVVMGRDRVDGPPGGALVERRYTNVWQLHGGLWRMVARHAQHVRSP